MTGMTLRCLAAIALAAMLVACGSEEPDADLSSRIASIQSVAGQAQTGPVGIELSDALVARVLNSSGAPIVGQVVAFRVSAGGGSAFAGSVVSDADGYARERWTLGTTAGPQEMEVRAVNDNGQSVVFARFTATALPGPASTIAVIAGGHQSGPQTTALPMPVQLLAADRYGNAAPGTPVSIAVSSGTTSVSSLTTGAGGTASVQWTMGMTLGPQTLTATLATGATATTGAVCTALPLGPPAAIIKLSGDLQTVAQYQPLVDPLEVQVLDANGRGVPDVRVTYTLPGGAGSGSAMTDTEGRARWRSASARMLVAGIQQIPASVAGLPAVLFEVTVTPSIHAYDGGYECSISNNQTPMTTVNLDLSIASSVVSGRTRSGSHEIPPNPTALDPLTGTLDIPKFKWSLDYSIDMRGTLTIDGAGRATGSGTSRRYLDPNPIPEAVTVWSCRRVG